MFTLQTPSLSAKPFLRIYIIVLFLKVILLLLLTLHLHFGAVKKPSPERSRLMGVMSDLTYYNCCGLFLQYTHGNRSDTDLKTISSKNLNDKELDAWSTFHRTLSTDAYGELITLCEELRRVSPALFSSK